MLGINPRALGECQHEDFPEQQAVFRIWHGGNSQSVNVELIKPSHPTRLDKLIQAPHQSSLRRLEATFRHTCTPMHPRGHTHAPLRPHACTFKATLMHP
eukprot:1160947-Pelagomonas_calceolata.AAC.19